MFAISTVSRMYSRSKTYPCLEADVEYIRDSLREREKSATERNKFTLSDMLYNILDLASGVTNSRRAAKASCSVVYTLRVYGRSHELPTFLNGREIPGRNLLGTNAFRNPVSVILAHCFSLRHAFSFLAPNNIWHVTSVSTCVPFIYI